MSRSFNRFMQHLTIDFTASFKESRRARLLVVDDDPFVRDLHTTVLRLNGYEIATAEDGVDALEQLADERFDLVLTDRNIPSIDGASIVLALRSAGSQIPIIMVSGSLAQTPLPAAIAREIFAAIPKPAQIAEVLSAVARAYHRRPPPSPTTYRRPRRLTVAAGLWLSRPCRRWSGPCSSAPAAPPVRPRRVGAVRRASGRPPRIPDRRRRPSCGARSRL